GSPHPRVGQCAHAIRCCRRAGPGDHQRVEGVCRHGCRISHHERRSLSEPDRCPATMGRGAPAGACESTTRAHEIAPEVKTTTLGLARVFGSGEMISSLRGEVAHIGLDSVVLEVHGVGYRVFTTPNTL